MKTKNGIELVLSESEYTYYYKGFTFYFSSELYKQKFIDRLEKYIKEETLKISSKYQIDIKLEEYLAFALYQKIEKRGFFVKIGSIELRNEFYFDSYFKK